jgi:hypothetical protein
MIFTQVKALPYCIFAIIVACQFPPGNYTIVNQVDFGELAAASSDPNADVIATPPSSDPNYLAMWRIEISSGLNTIQNIQTSTFLSNDKEKVVLASEPFLWRIESQNGGLHTISIEGSELYLSSEPIPAPDSVGLTSQNGNYTEWAIESI